MQIEENRVVTLAYELRRNGPEGEILEIMDEKWPFHFLFGAGRLLPQFEQQLQGLEEGATFSFTLKPEEAYGQREAGNILKLKRNYFDGTDQREPVQVRVGNFVAVNDDEGITHNGVITEFSDTEVTVDFNHAMAGMRLHFSGVVLRVREASVDELIRKHYIPEGGVRRSSV